MGQRSFLALRSLLPALALLIVATYLMPSGEDLSLLSFTAIFGLVAYSVAISFRYAGILMIAQGVVWGFGTYMTTLLVGRYGWTMWEVIPLAVIGSACLAVAIGAISLRSRGHYFLIVTFALNELIVYLVGTWSYVGGTNGLFMLNRPNDLGPINFSGSLARYYLFAAFLLLGIFIFVALEWTHFGRRLIAMRENEDLARSVGISLVRMRLEVLALGGALAGVAGVLYAYQEPAINPNLFDALAFLPLVAMVIIGGRAISLGPLLGAFLLELLPSKLNFSPFVSQLFYGLLVILIILLLPGGVGSIFIRVGILSRRLLSRHPSERRIQKNDEDSREESHALSVAASAVKQQKGEVQ